MYTRPATRERDFEQLMRTSYGQLPRLRRRRRGAAVAMTADAGTEVLTQPGVSGVVVDVEEYVVDREPVDLPQPPAPAPTALPPAPVPAPPVVAPSASSGSPPEHRPVEPPPAPPLMPAPVPVPSGPPQTPPGQSSPAPTEETPPPVLAGPDPVLPPALAGSPLTDADLADDVRNILSTGGAPAAPSGGVPEAPPEPVAPVRPMSEAPDRGKIFDAIAQSMQYSNSFDLGSVDLDLRNRFAAFDQTDHTRRPGAPAPATPPVRPFASLSREALRGLPLTDGCAGSEVTLGVAPARSVAMYDTGEHVLAGGDLYPDQLNVGQGAGVAFSYGQLIAMGDFYSDVDELKNAPASELSELKSRIVRNTAYYQKPRAQRQENDPDDISHEEWNQITGKRYLVLADQNYAHFSPPELLGLSDPISTPTNRSEWERIHERAIAEMKALVATNPTASAVPYGPLATNAFGDHFLTDAFASGHLVNKQVVIDRFRRVFYQPNSNTPSKAGADFLARLAKAAWAKPEVKATFSRLQLAKRDISKLGVKWNIDSVGMFQELLTAIAEKAPDKVENLCVKTLHDHLNRVGVEVTNANGDGPWTLHGDGYLDDTTRDVMRKAVQQSVDNILGPEILVSETDRGPLSLSTHGPLLAKVWRLVPVPTAAGRSKAVKALDTYTDLSGQTLVDAAAELLKKQATLVGNELIDRGELEIDGGSPGERL